MKSLKLLFIGVSVILFSCGDDESLSESIITSWDLQSIEITDCGFTPLNVPLTEVGSDGCISLQGETVCNVFFTFNAGGTATETYTIDGDTEMDTYSYTVNDDNNTVVLCDGSDCETLTVDGDELTRSSIDDCNVKAVYTKN